MLYHQDLNGWDAWGLEYQNILAFTPLAEEIYRRNGIGFVPLSPLTPGTNAVFRSGRTVIKIYTPDETGLSGRIAYEVELFSMRHGNTCGFPSPKVLADGYIDDKYRFYYLIMEYIDAPEFLAVRPTLSHASRISIAADFGRKLQRLNVPVQRFPAADACSHVKENRRWDSLPPEFRLEALRIAGEAAKEPQVYVHGDLNGDNVLFRNGSLHVIDFADSTIAPFWYECACVICDLFDFDRACAEAFTALSKEALASQLYRSLMLHDFGANIIEQNVRRRLGDDVVKSPSLLWTKLREWALK